MKKHRGQHRGNRNQGIVPRVPVVDLTTTPEGGTAIRIDLTRAPIPDTHFEADHWWTYHRDGALSVVFDQVPPGGEVTLRVECRMSYEAFSGLIATIDADRFKAVFQTYLEAHARIPGPATPKPTPETKAKIHHILRVSAIRLAHLGTDAEAVLFSLSPNELASMQRPGSGAPLAPRMTALARVSGTTHAMASLLADARGLAQEVAALLDVPGPKQ